jgi:hypothetical protein
VFRVKAGSSSGGILHAERKFKDFPRTFKAFFSTFKDQELGKIFENGTDLP